MKLKKLFDYIMCSLVSIIDQKKKVRQLAPVSPYMERVGFNGI